MSYLMTKCARAIQRHGLIGLVKVAATHLVQFVNNFSPSARADTLEREQRCALFDKQFGVDTSGYVHYTDLNVESKNQIHAASYMGSDPKYLREVLGTLPIDYRNFSLVDFGSGKGRVILLATEYPFKRIVGVEFSEDLHKIAQENIRRFHRDRAKCTEVESIRADAATYALPNDALVCYFFNPFGATIMSQVLANIEKSLRQTPREMFVVYANPIEGNLFDRSKSFKKVGANGPVCIWRATSEVQSSTDSKK